MLNVKNTEVRDVWLVDLQHGPRCVVFVDLMDRFPDEANITFHGVEDSEKVADLFETHRECLIAAAHRAVRQAARWLDEAGVE